MVPSRNYEREDRDVETKDQVSHLPKARSMEEGVSNEERSH